MEIYLWGWYWWNSCNGGITFWLSKKVHELASKAKGTHCVIHRCALARRTVPTPLKNVLDSTIKLSITSNLQALTPACLKNFAWIQHTEFFYSTRLYAGYRKEMFHLRLCDMTDEGRNKGILRNENQWIFVLHWWQDLVEMFCVFGRNFEKLDNLNLATTKGYKHHSASRRICKHFANLVSSSNWKTLLCLRNCQVLLKKFKNLMRVWRHRSRPPSIRWKWVPTIFVWAQGGRKCTCTKDVLYLSGYSQHSQWITGPILLPSEWFISTWYFSWNDTSWVLVSYAWYSQLSELAFRMLLTLPQHFSASAVFQL